MKKILIIFHLCFVCSWLCIDLGRPFLGEYFTIRSRLLLYEYVLAIPSPQVTTDQRILREQASEELSSEVRSQLSQEYLALVNYANRPVWQKMGDGILFLWTKVPFLESFWIISSLLLGIALLKGKPNAAHAAWFLPCLILTQLWLFPPKIPNQTETLFPTESWLLSHYSQKTLPSSFAGQHQVIQAAWEEFLLQEWSAAPSAAERERRLVSGYLHFQTAQLLHQKQESHSMGVGWLTLGFISSLLIAYFHQENNRKQPIPAV